MPINNFSEFGLIEQIKKWLDQKRLRVKIGDDAAAFSLKPKLLTLFSTDSLIENVHFNLGTITPWDLGYKSLVVNVSDIAAMGGKPKFATLALGLPPKIDLAFIKNFYKGLNEAASTYSLTIAGGDLTSAKELVISVSLIGQVQKNKILKRTTAKIGDLVLVTGNLGASAAGLKLASEISNIKNQKSKMFANTKIEYFLKKHFRPEARVKQAQLAAQIGVKTAIDISDGLVSDCQRICEASNVGCRIYADRIPVDKHVVAVAKSLKIDPLQAALSGGEDYELIFCASKNKASKLKGAFQKKKWPINVVGETTSKGIEVVDKNGKQIKWQRGYEHFR